MTEEFTTTDKNDYITPSILGTYSLNNEEMDKIGGRARKEVALKFENENNLKGNDISLNNYDVQGNYGSSAQEIKLREKIDVIVITKLVLPIIRYITVSSQHIITHFLKITK